jgi:hypothetical protein
MSFQLPMKSEFDKVRYAIWRVFEIVLMVLAMVAAVGAEWKHTQ